MVLCSVEQLTCHLPSGLSWPLLIQLSDLHRFPSLLERSLIGLGKQILRINQCKSTFNLLNVVSDLLSK